MNTKADPETYANRQPKWAKYRLSAAEAHHEEAQDKSGCRRSGTERDSDIRHRRQTGVDGEGGQSNDHGEEDNEPS
jgi:hypothetical protein